MQRPPERPPQKNAGGGEVALHPLGSRNRPASKPQAFRPWQNPIFDELRRLIEAQRYLTIEMLREEDYGRLSRGRFLAFRWPATCCVSSSATPPPAGLAGLP